MGVQTSMQTCKGEEISVLEEVRQRAEKMKERRRSAIKVVSCLWNRNIITEDKEDKDGGKEELKTKKELELADAAEKFEKKRRISGKWLGRCKPQENDSI